MPAPPLLRTALSVAVAVAAALGTAPLPAAAQDLVRKPPPAGVPDQEFDCREAAAQAREAVRRRDELGFTYQQEMLAIAHTRMLADRLPRGREEQWRLIWRGTRIAEAAFPRVHGPLGSMTQDEIAAWFMGECRKPGGLDAMLDRERWFGVHEHRRWW